MIFDAYMLLKEMCSKVNGNPTISIMFSQHGQSDLNEELAVQVIWAHEGWVLRYRINNLEVLHVGRDESYNEILIAHIVRYINAKYREALSNKK